jgi:hypothetical protein
VHVSRNLESKILVLEMNWPEGVKPQLKNIFSSDVHFDKL